MTDTAKSLSTCAPTTNFSDMSNFSEDPQTAQAQDSQPLDEFSLFPQLPTEIQLGVWKFVMEEGRIVCIEAASTPELHPKESVHRFISPTPNPAILYVNHQSRNEALKIYEPQFRSNTREHAKFGHRTIYLNPLKDMAYFSLPLSYDSVLQNQTVLKWILNSIELATFELISILHDFDLLDMTLKVYRAQRITGFNSIKHFAFNLSQDRTADDDTRQSQYSACIELCRNFDNAEEITLILRRHGDGNIRGGYKKELEITDLDLDEDVDLMDVPIMWGTFGELVDGLRKDFIKRYKRTKGLKARAVLSWEQSKEVERTRPKIVAKMIESIQSGGISLERGETENGDPRNAMSS